MVEFRILTLILLLLSGYTKSNGLEVQYKLSNNGEPIDEYSSTKRTISNAPYSPNNNVNAYQHVVGSWVSLSDSLDIISLRFYPDSNQIVMSSTDKASKPRMSRGYLFPVSYSTPYENILRGVYTAWGGTSCTLQIISKDLIEINLPEGKIAYEKLLTTKPKRH